MAFNVLVLDPGSSSLKFGVYGGSVGSVRSVASVELDLKLLASGIIDRLGTSEAELKLETPGRPTRTEHLKAVSCVQSAEIALQRMQEALPVHLGGGGKIQAVGCRVVHGGDRFVESKRVSHEVLTAIRELSPLAPLHNPAAADVLETCLRVMPDVPIVAVFDTSFNKTLPTVARTYALPFELCQQHHIHRYGFHGIAHKYVSGRLLECIGKVGQESRCITCHLGNGASICAVRDGKSIDTSMGMTPMEGLVMGTRSGDVDPGVLLYLLRNANMAVEELDDILNHKSGLLGISGRSSDLRDLEKAAAEGDSRSELAMEVFAYRASKMIGAYAVVLEGLDAIAFSGGIGENSAPMRERICMRLGLLGVNLDKQRNRDMANDEPERISTGESTVQIWVIHADENRQIALETSECLARTEP
jgi:acetate kinase